MPSPPGPSTRLAVDVGGTHTDFLLFHGATGAVHVHKTLTTPEDPSLAIARGLEALMRRSGVAAGEIGELIHSFSVPANLVRARAGATVGLLLTRDFEQVLHLGAPASDRNPGPGGDQTKPLVDLALTMGIVERISPRGDTVVPLDEAAARESIAALLRAGVDCIAVSLLHSYANPAHELRIKELIREANEQLPVFLSHEAAPQSGEYERTLATVINAYTQAGTQAYLARLNDTLKSAQISSPTRLMQSSGGLAAAEQIGNSPIQLLQSTLASSACGAARVAALGGYPQALAIDMGGTSATICLIRDGAPRLSNHTPVPMDRARAGLSCGIEAISIPSVDVRTIGAGAGSIAHAPLPGMLRVGPQGAGAAPGPACYGNGATAATITDAQLVLGHLPAAPLSLNLAAAQDAVAAFGRQLGLDLHRAAEGILALANESMAGALQSLAVERGQDTASLALVVSGGAGPMHACELSALTGCTPVIVPRNAGVVAALGLLSADLGTQFVQTIVQAIDQIQANALVEIAEQLREQARQWLAHATGNASAENVSGGQISLRADVRYLRSEFQASLPFDLTSGAESAALQALAARFEAAHQRRFGLKLDQAIELVTLRVLVDSASSSASSGSLTDRDILKKRTLGPADPAAALLEHTQVYFDGSFAKTAVYDRARLKAGHHLNGPAIVTQSDATTVIQPGYMARVDGYLNLLIQALETTPQVHH